MALTVGQRAWLDALIEQPREGVIEGKVVHVTEDADKATFIVEGANGRVTYQAERVSEPSEEMGKDRQVAFRGEVSSWSVDDDNEVTLRVESQAGFFLERVYPPLSQTEQDAEVKAAQDAIVKRRAARDAALAKVKANRTNGQRTPQQTAELIDNLALLVEELLDTNDTA